MNKLRYSWLNQLWIPSVPLAVGTPLKLVLGLLGR